MHSSQIVFSCAECASIPGGKPSLYGPSSAQLKLKLKLALGALSPALCPLKGSRTKPNPCIQLCNNNNGRCCRYITASKFRAVGGHGRGGAGRGGGLVAKTFGQQWPRDGDVDGAGEAPKCMLLKYNRLVLALFKDPNSESMEFRALPTSFVDAVWAISLVQDMPSCNLANYCILQVPPCPSPCLGPVWPIFPPQSINQLSVILTAPASPQPFGLFVAAALAAVASYLNNATCPLTLHNLWPVRRAENRS